MKIQNFQVKRLPVVVIDNYYDEQAMSNIWAELNFISKRDKLNPPDKTGSANIIDPNSKEVFLKKKNKGLFLDDVYVDRKFSDILHENRKIFNADLVSKLIDIDIYFRHILKSTADSTLISYYEDSDYYKSHADDASVTVCSWFFQEPKRFEGGDFVIEDEVKIKCQNNRTVIFPSILEHAVEEVEMYELNRNKNFGRYTITQLIGYRL